MSLRSVTPVPFGPHLRGWRCWSDAPSVPDKSDRGHTPHDRVVSTGVVVGSVGGHQSTHTFLSGIRSDQAKQYPEGNVTVDQRAAEFVDAETRYQSMQLGLGGGGVSWTRNGVEIPTITRLQTMFDAVFMETPESKRKRQAGAFAVNRSILDIVGEDVAALKKRISLGDSTKLDDYFTSICEVEKRLEQSEAWLNKPKPN